MKVWNSEVVYKVISNMTSTIPWSSKNQVPKPITSTFEKLKSWPVSKMQISSYPFQCVGLSGEERATNSTDTFLNHKIDTKDLITSFMLELMGAMQKDLHVQ